MKEVPPLTRRTLGYHLIMVFVHLAYTLIWPTRIRGREHVPDSGRVLVAANHQSFLDIPLVSKGLAGRHASFVARDSLARSRFLRWVLSQTGAILIDRTKGDRAALRSMVAHLEGEDAVVVFPEGTRSKDGSLGRPKKGFLLAARQSGAPIVPCAVSGSHRAWPRSRRLPRPGRVNITFGPAVDPARPDALEATWGAIAALLDDTSAASN